MFTLGWDPSRKGFHQLVLVDETKTVLGDWKTHGFEEAYKALLVAKAQATQCKTKLQIGYEQDNSIILDKLFEYEAGDLYSLNARRVESYKAALAVTDKTDYFDGYSCACFLIDFRPKLRPFKPLSPLIKEAKQISSQLDEIRGQKTLLWERLWDTIERVSIDLKTITGESRETAWFLSVLSYMTPRVKHTGFPGFLKYCRKQGSKMHDDQLRSLHAELKLLNKEGLSEIITPKASMIKLLLEEKKHWEKRAGETLIKWEDGWILKTIKGMGAGTEIRLVAELGTDWSKWSPQSISKYGGVAPRLSSSGTPDEATLLKMPKHKRKKISLHRGHRVACNKRLKTTLCLFSLYSMVYNEWAKSDYDRFRQRGQSHWEALRNLAIKWVRIFCALLEKKEAYDEYSHRTEKWRRADPLRRPR